MSPQHNTQRYIERSILNLPLHPSATVALGELFHFLDADTVEVTLNTVLEGRGGHGKLDGLCRDLTRQERIDQSRAEGIAAAHAIDDMEAVGFGEVVVLSIVEHGRPVVIAGRDGGTEGNGHLLESELIGELLGYALVALVVQLTAVDVGVLGLDAEDVLCIFFIGDADVHVLAEVGHSGSCLLSRPQLAAVVQVTGDLDTALLGGLAGFLQICTKFSPRAGVIPVKWNQSAPSKIASQSKSVGSAIWMAEYLRS